VCSDIIWHMRGMQEGGPWRWTIYSPRTRDRPPVPPPPVLLAPTPRDPALALPMPPRPMLALPLLLFSLGMCRGVPARSSPPAPSRSLILLPTLCPMLDVPRSRPAHARGAHRKGQGRRAGDASPRSCAPRTPRPARLSPPPWTAPTSAPALPTTLPANKPPPSPPPQTRTPAALRLLLSDGCRDCGIPVRSSPASTPRSCGRWPPSPHRATTWTCAMKPNTWSPRPCAPPSTTPVDCSTTPTQPPTTCPHCWTCWRPRCCPHGGSPSSCDAARTWPPTTSP